MKYFLVTFSILVFVFSALGQTATSQNKVTFEKVKLANIGTIEIPSIMELQSGIYKEFSDSLIKKEFGIDSSGTIIFQQSGLNNVFTSKTPTTTYARVMIKEILGKAREFRKLNAKIPLTKQEVKELDSFTKSEMEEGFQSAKMKLLRWDGVSVTTLNGQNALKIAYLRQLETNPSVYVEMYRLENYDREYVLTISYRYEDATFWKDALEKTKNSFTITNIK